MTKFNFSDIKFGVKENRFYHNIGDDFACFALWKSARPYRDEIRRLLSEEFEILAELEIKWSEKYFNDNASRLYEVPINYKSVKEDWKSNHAKKIGDTTFILFIIKDNTPQYSYAMSVSKKIELSNLNVVRVKYQMRDLIEKDTGAKYGVHSTNNIYEFFYQVPLLLGVDLFEKILDNKKIEEKFIEKDLEGAGGWSNYHYLFKLLNVASNYLVQRGFETLPFENEEKDIDFLTDNYQRLASLLGAYQEPLKPYKGNVLVNNEKIDVDIRFVGDKYYDASWQKNMLEERKLNNGVYIPREDDYFFSLLYHCKVQKKEVKKKYIPILKELANNLNFQWFTPELLADNKSIGNILNGYFQSQGYSYENPIDAGVIKNGEVIKYLPINLVFKPNVSAKQRIKKMIKSFLPKEVVSLLRKNSK